MSLYSSILCTSFTHKLFTLFHTQVMALNSSDMSPCYICMASISYTIFYNLNLSRYQANKAIQQFDYFTVILMTE